ncbi:DUF5666 domain-containing protein [Jiangella asiatica]|uniref:DUF5666 domain-containing protein n=1 Tax=Jiangella asiatica TaxID=2530372 RepID=UPI0013A5E20E|nr:DUF5666 domain-containing protein [Jiangella asiatica]
MLRRFSFLLVPLVIAAGCGAAEDGDTTADDDAATASADGDAIVDEPDEPAAPGAAGLVAAVDGTTLQVQSDSGQVAVTYTDATEITATTEGTAADLAVGSCVVVETEEPAGEETATEVAAVAVSVTLAGDDGGCSDGGAGNGGPGPVGRPTDRPSGPPTDRPEDAPPRSPDDIAGRTIGVVTAVDGDTFTVEATTPVRPFEDEDGAATAEPTTTEVAVTTSESTAWSVEVVSGPDALVVGSCASALGSADDTGAITATTIAIHPAADGACPWRTRGGEGA